MADLSLLASVLDAMRPEARIVFVGDVDQLPSVGPGTCFRDLIASGVVPVARLTKIYRQCEGSRIATNCRAINAGEMPEFEDAADSFFCAAEPEEIWPQIESIYLDRIASFAYRAEDVQVLTPQRKTDNGIDSLNLRLQALLNPDVGQDAWTFPTKTFRLGERVIQKKNNYQIQSLDGCEPGCFNGEVGKVVEFRGYGQGERMIVDMGARDHEAGSRYVRVGLRAHDPFVAGVGVPGGDRCRDEPTQPDAESLFILHGDEPAETARMGGRRRTRDGEGGPHDHAA